MQGDSGLPRARPTLDDEHSGQRRADDFVLLALDRPDDVAHLACPRLAQGGQQRAGPSQHEAVGQKAVPAVADLRSPGARWCSGPGASFGIDEVLVFEAEDRPTPHGEMPAARQPLRVEARSPVERLRHGGAPVDDERFVVRAGDGQPPDVEGLPQQRVVRGRLHLGLREPVDPSEVKRLVSDIELFQAGQAGPHDNVALGARLERAAPAQVEHTLQHLPRLAPHELQAVVGTIEELLLILQIWMFGHLSPSSPRPRGNGSV